MTIAIKATAFAVIEAGGISFFLWTSYFLAHIIVGAA
jgi:hypothetical protein